MKKYINVYSLSILLVVVVLLLGIGYAAFGTKLLVTDTVAKVRIVSDIRVTNFVADSATSEGVSNYEEYNVNSISSGITLPNSDSTVKYKVSVTNFGNVDMGILSITGLPSNLTYTLTDYTLKNKICDTSGNCKLGITQDFYITIKYKNSSSYDSSNTNYDIKLDFDFRKFYTIAYGSGVSEKFSKAATEVIEGAYATLSLSGSPYPSNLIVKMGDTYLGKDTGGSTIGTASNYYFLPGSILFLPIVSGNIEIDRICEPITDSSNLTTGNLPTGEFALGDEYICNVDGTNSYHFFVLSTEGNNVNLIMDHSVNSSGGLSTGVSDSATPYLSTSDGSDATYGPITAFNFLSTATSSWVTVPRISMGYIYSDSTVGGFSTSTTDTSNTVSIINTVGTTTATYDNLKVRLPYESEVTAAGCTTSSGSCPSWLTGNIYGAGYWIIPTSTSSVNIICSGSLYPVSGVGGITNKIVVTARPVITLTKNDLYWCYIKSKKIAAAIFFYIFYL